MRLSQQISTVYMALTTNSYGVDATLKTNIYCVYVTPTTIIYCVYVTLTTNIYCVYVTPTTIIYCVYVTLSINIYCVYVTLTTNFYCVYVNPTSIYCAYKTTTINIYYVYVTEINICWVHNKHKLLVLSNGHELCSLWGNLDSHGIAITVLPCRMWRRGDRYNLTALRKSILPPSSGKKWFCYIMVQ